MLADVRSATRRATLEARGEMEAANKGFAGVL
jgi:hypothetical protein